MPCAVFHVQCEVRCVQGEVCSVPGEVCSVQWEVCSVEGATCIVQCLWYSVDWGLKPEVPATIDDLSSGTMKSQ